MADAPVFKLIVVPTGQTKTQATPQSQQGRDKNKPQPEKVDPNNPPLDEVGEKLAMQVATQILAKHGVPGLVVRSPRIADKAMSTPVVDGCCGRGGDARAITYESCQSGPGTSEPDWVKTAIEMWFLFWGAAKATDLKRHITMYVPPEVAAVYRWFSTFKVGELSMTTPIPQGAINPADTSFRPFAVYQMGHNFIAPWTATTP